MLSRFGKFDPGTTGARTEALHLYLWGCLALALAGCGTTYVSPSLSSQQMDTAATLELPSGVLGTGTVRLTAVDGKSVGDGRVTTALLAPGRHALTLRLEKGSASPPPLYLLVDLQARTNYRLEFEITETDHNPLAGTVRGTWNAWVIDVANGATVSRRDRYGLH